jgi:hypothetical protein
LGLIAGPFNLVLAVSIGGLLPGASAAALAGLVGFAGYGISLVLFVLALRDLGTARTGAYFATAPLVGAVAAIAFLHEPLTLQLAAAGLLMGTGVWLHVTEIHDHEHAQEAMEIGSGRADSMSRPKVKMAVGQSATPNTGAPGQPCPKAMPSTG